MNTNAPVMSIEEIYFAVIEYDDSGARAAYLDAVCGIDTELRQRVERLLDARSQRGSFLEPPAPDPTLAYEVIGTVIGPYKLLEQIGEGGMGVVYMAEQTQPVRRKVALKVIKPGMDTKQVIARFEAERQVLALMDHPNIARMLDAGATESGPPYFVMELVRGISITEYCDQHRLSIDERLDLFATVCQAVEHAHQQDVIHRDIKPSNVLITLHDGVPVPKIIDFGVAKAIGQSLAEKTLFTGFAQFIGTSLYMSPEQAELSGIDIDIRSDVYPLGVLLYELLTGTTPFDQDTFRRAAFDEVRRIIREQEPPKPSARLSGPGLTLKTVSANRQTDERKLNRSIHGELDWITMKALEKDRRRRYQTAAAFAADIRRYRANEPVEAGPPSARYRCRKFLRRNRAIVTTTAVLLTMAAIVVGIWVRSSGQLHRVQRIVEQSRSKSERQEVQALHHRYVADIRQAEQFVRSGHGRRALELLHKYRPTPGEQDERNFAWYYLMRLCHDERRTLRGHTGDVYHAEFSPDGRTLVSCGKDGAARFWDVATGRPLRTITIQAAGDVNWADFSSDGRILATASDDGTVRLWDAATCASQAVIPAHKGVAVYVRFVSDGRLVSAGRNDGEIKLWDLATRREITSARANEGLLENVAFSPDGKTLATAGGDGRPRLWNAANLSPIPTDLQYGSTVFGIAFSADASRLVTGDVDRRVRTWDLPGGKERNEFRGFQHSADVQSVAFLAEDRMIVSGGDHGILRLWDAATGTGLGTLMGHTEKIWGVSVSPDGKSLATASADGTVKLWDAKPPRHELVIPSPGPGATRFSFTSNGRSLVFARSVGRSLLRETDGTPYYYLEDELEVYGIDPITGAKQFHRTLEKGRQTLPYGPNLTPGCAMVIFSFVDGTVTTWEIATGKQLATINDVMYIVKAHQQFVLVYRKTGPSELVDAATGQSRHLFPRTETSDVLGCTRAGDVFALRDHDELILWDMAANQARCRRLGDHTAAIRATFSPDSTILATIDRNLTIHLWDARNLAPLGTPLIGHSESIGSLGFSPDGKTLLSASNDGTVRLWDVAAYEELLTLRKSPHQIASAQFSPDGRSLAFDWDGFRVLSTRLPEDLHSEEEP
jgi:eukaryotic-like serine/threonine-protein kinase